MLADNREEIWCNTVGVRQKSRNFLSNLAPRVQAEMGSGHIGFFSLLLRVFKDIVKENGDFKVMLCRVIYHNDSGDNTTVAYKKGQASHHAKNIDWTLLLRVSGCHATHDKDAMGFVARATSTP